MNPSKSVPNVLLRFMSTPQSCREAESLLVYAAPVIGLALGVQKFAAFGSSVSRPPFMHQLVSVRRCRVELCIE
jgi:hypothetical protein